MPRRFLGEPENHSRGGRRPGAEEGRTEEEAAGSRGGRRCGAWPLGTREDSPQRGKSPSSWRTGVDGANRGSATRARMAVGVDQGDAGRARPAAGADRGGVGRARPAAGADRDGLRVKLDWRRR